MTDKQLRDKVNKMAELTTKQEKMLKFWRCWEIESADLGSFFSFMKWFVNRFEAEGK